MAQRTWTAHENFQYSQLMEWWQCSSCDNTKGHMLVMYQRTIKSPTMYLRSLSKSDDWYDRLLQCFTYLHIKLFRSLLYIRRSQCANVELRVQSFVLIHKQLFWEKPYPTWVVYWWTDCVLGDKINHFNPHKLVPVTISHLSTAVDSPPPSWQRWLEHAHWLPVFLCL